MADQREQGPRLPILRQRQLGTRYFHETLADREISPGLSIIDATIGDFEYFPPRQATKIWREATSGLLYRELASKRKEVDLSMGKEHILRRWNMDGENVYVHIGIEGSDGILQTIAEKLISAHYGGGRGRSLLIGIGPHFPPIINYATNGGVDYVPLFPPTLKQPYQTTIDNATQRILQEPRGNVAIFIADPSSLTGASLPIESKIAFVEDALRKNFIVIFDEALGDALPDSQSLIPWVASYPNLIVTRSLSKMAGIPGEGIGYAVMPKNIGNEFEKLHVPFYIPRTNQYFINHILNPDILVPHIKGARVLAENIRLYTLDLIKSIGLEVYETDEENGIPVFLVNGGRPHFREILRDKLHMLTANIADFAESYPPFGTPDDKDMEYSESANRLVRFVLPNNKKRAYEMVRRLWLAKAFAAAA